MAEADTKEQPASLRWWGRRPIPDQGAELIRVGPTELWVQREAGQLLIGHHEQGDPLDSRVVFAAVEAGEKPPEGMTWVRLALGVGAESYLLSPLSADRAMIARPEVPAVIPPGASLRTFVSLPLWLRLEAGPARLELPIRRPTDTWFGATTVEGELCYACQTTLRDRREALPTRPHRAITPVMLWNRGEDPLEVRRLRLPAPYLAIFAEQGEGGGLETPGITLERVAGERTTLLRIATLEREPVSPARRTSSGLQVIRVLNSFLP